MMYSAERVAIDAIPFQMLVANGWLLLIGLIPHYATVNGVRMPNDALRLIHLIRGSPTTVRLHQQPETATGSSGPSWHWTVSQVPVEILLAQFRTRLEDAKLSPSERDQVLDAFATAVLMYGAHEFLTEADRYSEELYRSKPDEWTVKGTRGSILVEKGDIESGQAMLKDVVEHDPSAVQHLGPGVHVTVRDLDVLLEAWRGIGGAELWVVGMPRLPLKSLRARVTPSVRLFPRFVPEAQVPAWFRRADLVVLPYREIDQSGVLFTALAFGKPLLLTSVGGFPEVAETGAAELVVAGDSSALHIALRRLLDDPRRREALAAAAREAAATTYSWDGIAARHLELYESLLRDNPRP
jgi:glycosyltransferase involved in cell wall biosynthesis